MDYEEAIHHLGAAENIALQTLVVAILNEMAVSGDKDFAKRVFERADKVLEIATLRMGSGPPEKLFSAHVRQDGTIPENVAYR